MDRLSCGSLKGAVSDDDRYFDNKSFIRKQYQTTALESKLNNVDLLVREYFSTAPPERLRMRKAIAKYAIQSYISALEILKWSSRNGVNSYGCAVELLSEFNNIKLFQDTASYLIYSTEMKARPSNSSQILDLQTYWEVFLKGIACAYRIAPQERLGLLIMIDQVLVPQVNRRMIKAFLIDGSDIIADGNEDIKSEVRLFLQRFIDPYEPDECLRTYAHEVLQNLS